MKMAGRLPDANMAATFLTRMLLVLSTKLGGIQGNEERSRITFAPGH